MKTVYLYTDGACSGNPGPGGWGAVLRWNQIEKELSGGEAETTNNRMELMAVIAGLQALKEPCEVHLTSDSKYVIDGLSKGWAKGWRSRAVGAASGAVRKAHGAFPLDQGTRRPSGKRALRPAGGGAEPPLRRPPELTAPRQGVGRI